MIEIGNLKIDGAVLAPMAGFTDSAYRQICREMGAGLVVSEMISAKALCFGDKKTAALIDFKDCERPYALQLFGSEPESMADAAEMLATYKPDLIDINMGCPVPKIVGSGSGSALLKNHKLAGEIVSAVARRISIPVSVKMRIGWDDENICAADFAKRLEDCGASLISVHGRTREQFYAPSARLEPIADVKKSVKIPVIANGDIASFYDAKKMLEVTGCDGFMIGRAALGNPFIFKEISEGEEHTPPDFDEKMAVLSRLCKLEIQNKGERLALLELRRHLPFFFKGIRDAASLRRMSTCVNTLEDIEKVIKTAFKLNTQNEEEKRA